MSPWVLFVLLVVAGKPHPLAMAVPFPSAAACHQAEKAVMAKAKDNHGVRGIVVTCAQPQIGVKPEGPST